MIEISEQFEVLAPPQTVWELLSDPVAVVGCVPGAAIVGRQPDGSLDTTLTVKFGPLRVGFQAQAVLELEPEHMRGRLSARGKDNQGGYAVSSKRVVQRRLPPIRRPGRVTRGRRDHGPPRLSDRGRGERGSKADVGGLPQVSQRAMRGIVASRRG